MYIAKINMLSFIDLLFISPLKNEPCGCDNFEGSIGEFYDSSVLYGYLNYRFNTCCNIYNSPLVTHLIKSTANGIKLLLLSPRPIFEIKQISTRLSWILQKLH